MYFLSNLYFPLLLIFSWVPPLLLQILVCIITITGQCRIISFIHFPFHPSWVPLHSSGKCHSLLVSLLSLSPSPVFSFLFYFYRLKCNYNPSTSTILPVCELQICFDAFFLTSFIRMMIHGRLTCEIVSLVSEHII